MISCKKEQPPTCNMNVIIPPPINYLLATRFCTQSATPWWGGIQIQPQVTTRDVLHVLFSLHCLLSGSTNCQSLRSQRLLSVSLRFPFPKERADGQGALPAGSAVHRPRERGGGGG